MRYIGNKENIIEKIQYILNSNEVCGNSFFDFFSGTANVAKHFKRSGYKVYSSDIMYMSFCLQMAYIKNNSTPTFETLLKGITNAQPHSTLFDSPLDIVLNYLNNIKPTKGFIYNNYTPGGTAHLNIPRMYFSDENGMLIDAIRQQIETWKTSELITTNEYYILLACLIESVSFYANISGVYAAFQKKWDPRAIKRLTLRPIEIINNNKENFVYNTNSISIADKIEVDILYLDPPYNERQYLPNYHILETIARYDNPTIKGVTGMREYHTEKSVFCNSKKALEALDFVAQNAKYKFMVLSYNSEGIMEKHDIINTLSKYGHVRFEEFQYTRFKSNNNGLSKTKKHIYEQIYILSRNE